MLDDTPLERAQRAVEKWNFHWAKSASINALLANIKREIEEAVEAAYERAAVAAEEPGDWECQGAAERIRALKGD